MSIMTILRKGALAVGLWDALRGMFAKKTPPEPAAEKKKAEPPEEPALWQSDMILRRTGDGKHVSYPGCTVATGRAEWVSRQTDEAGQPLSVRVPKPKTVVLPAGAFVAAGRAYTSVKQLDPTRYGDGTWSRDKYGRRVLCLWERFPCFDSSDLLYEKRFFRWFYLYENGVLTRVQHTDERPIVTVTEDVLDIEDDAWEKIRQLGCFQ